MDEEPVQEANTTTEEGDGSEKKTSAEESPAMDERPSDEAIVHQQNELRAEQVKISPLIGTVDRLSVYEEEFKNGNVMFLDKLRFLSGKYWSARRVRRDGNCFFRSFIFGYVESLLKTNNLAERDRMKNHMEVCKKKLMDAGFQELVFEDALGVLEQRIEQIGNVLSVEEWELVMNDDSMSNYIVMFLRLLTSAEIQLRREFFAPFIMGISDVLDVELFCQRMVEVMDEESDEIHIRALTDALEIPTRVYSLDSQPPIEMLPTDYIPDTLSNKDIIVHLLYRPGHYDIIYPIRRS